MPARKMAPVHSLNEWNGPGIFSQRPAKTNRLKPVLP
jgi:hypothetical protein